MIKIHHISRFPAAQLALHLAVAVIVPAFAQTSPDAGALQQQIERERRPALPPSAIPVTPDEPALQKTSPGSVVTVKAFQFAGNTLLSSEALAPVVAGYLDRPLQFADLQQAAAAVSEAYRVAGWLVRAYLPRQDITDGIVTLQIVEGLFGAVRLEGTPPSRLASGRAEAMIAATQPTGKPLNAPALDRALLMLDDLPGVAVSGNLAPGTGEAKTDLILMLSDEPLFRGEGGIDNTGSRATGEQRLTASAFLSSPLKIGDQLAVNLIHSDGSDYARLAYSLPVGHDGLRLGINSSQMNYKAITSEFSAANIHGNSSNTELDVQYPLIRSRSRNLYLSAAYDVKAFANNANGSTSTRYGARNLGIGMVGNLFDKWGGGGANFASLHFTAGDLDLDGSPNKATDATTTQTQGNFTKLRYALSRQQALTPELSLYAQLTGQHASKNLDSSEKFYLGGANGVRAYPANEGGGSEGKLVNLELRWRAMTNLVIAGFYDWGHLSVNKNNLFTGAPALNSYELHGFGASVAWTGPLGLNLKGTYARRLGSNPNRNATTENDQDGSLIRDRLWLTATLPF